MEQKQSITEKINSQNLDIVFHSLVGDTDFLHNLFFKYKDEPLQYLPDKYRKKMVEFKMFFIGYFLNFIKKENINTLNEFTPTCINQLYFEIDTVPYYSDEDPLNANLGFALDEEYIREKLQYYMEDCEQYIIDSNHYPKFTYLSLGMYPLENTTSDFFDRFQSVQFDNEFQENYKKVMWFLGLRAADSSKFELERLNFIKTYLK